MLFKEQQHQCPSLRTFTSEFPSLTRGSTRVLANHQCSTGQSLRHRECTSGAVFETVHRTVQSRPGTVETPVFSTVSRRHTWLLLGLGAQRQRRLRAPAASEQPWWQIIHRPLTHDMWALVLDTCNLIHGQFNSREEGFLLICCSRWNFREREAFFFSTTEFTHLFWLLICH